MAWIGHLSYLGKGKYNLVDSALVLSQFGRSRSQARRRYRQFFLEGGNELHQEKYYKVKDQRYLGEDEFVEKSGGLKKSKERKNTLLQLPNFLLLHFLAPSIL